MSTLWDYVLRQQKESDIAEVLPMMHSCECFDSRLIINSERLEARPCKVLKKDVLYFFYGKPSYPVGEKVEGNRTDIEYCPVCFIVNPSKVKIYRVFPFDTGAFDADKYEKFMHCNMGMDEFELEGTIEAILKYIALFYENNENYIRGQAVKCTKTYNPYIDALVSLLNAQGTYEIDDRSRTVEVTTQEHVYLKDAVECVILPEDLLRDERIRDFLDSNNIMHIEYTVRALTAPSRYNEVVFEKAMEYTKLMKGGKVGALFV